MRYLKVFENFNKRKFDELELDDIEDFLMGVVDERKLSISELVKYDKEKKPAFLYNKYSRINLYNTESKPSTYELIKNPLICFRAFIPHPNRVINSSFDINEYTKSILGHYLRRIYNNYDVDIYIHVYYHHRNDYESNLTQISTSFVKKKKKNKEAYHWNRCVLLV